MEKEVGRILKHAQDYMYMAEADTPNFCYSEKTKVVYAAARNKPLMKFWSDIDGGWIYVEQVKTKYEKGHKCV